MTDDASRGDWQRVAAMYDYLQASGAGRVDYLVSEDGRMYRQGRIVVNPLAQLPDSEMPGYTMVFHWPVGAPGLFGWVDAGAAVVAPRERLYLANQPAVFQFQVDALFRVSQIDESMERFRALSRGWDAVLQMLLEEGGGEPAYERLLRGMIAAGLDLFWTLPPTAEQARQEVFRWVVQFTESTGMGGRLSPLLQAQPELYRASLPVNGVRRPGLPVEVFNQLWRA